MFQRLRGAIDSRIAEEQARQRASQTSSSRSNSAVRRSTSGADSPARRTSRAREKRENAPAGKGPDPAEFEPEFVVGDDDSTLADGESPGIATPSIVEEEKEKLAEEKPLADEQKDATPATDAPKPSSELPTEVRVKLRKLDKLEARYQELLKAYRTAHARVISIEPFEATLRENTPLTSISDPGALLEYLEQVRLKGDMAVEEFKSAAAQRDEYKKKLEDAVKSAKDAWDEVAGLKKQKKEQSDTSSVFNGTSKEESIDTSSASDDPHGPPLKSPVTSPKPRKPSLAAMFSPKTNPLKSPLPKVETEEFFSYDSEVPRLEVELQEAKEEVVDLQSQLTKVKGDLAVARESTEGMVQTLESSTRELQNLRDSHDKQDNELSGLKKQHAEEIDALNVRAKEEASTARAEYDNIIAMKDEELSSIKQKTTELEQGNEERDKQIVSFTTDAAQKNTKIATLSALVDNLKGQVKDTESKIKSLQHELEERKSAPTKQASTEEDDHPLLDGERDRGEVLQADSSATGKKRNKKKKKGKGAAANVVDSAKSHAEGVVVEATADRGTSRPESIDKLQKDVEDLRTQLQEKESAIERLSNKIKDQESLDEEIETLRDDLLNIGQEHVIAKDNVKSLTTEKSALEETIGRLEKELSELRVTSATSAAGSEQAHNDLTAEFEELKTKATTLQTDLSIAQQLATSRFKELTELRDILQKAHPEMKSLKAELEETRDFKEKFGAKSIELRRLEARHEDLLAEVKGLKNIIAERDADVKTLNQKINQESNSRLNAEETLGIAESDLRYSESKKQEVIESNQKTLKDLTKAQEELRASRMRISELEEQSSRVEREADELKEEIQLKTAQYASAQSLMSSMRDQTSELGMQMKEAREKCENLEEELGEAQRMLSERSREGETMRRLLADVEGRADAKVREYKERMDAAIEERDRAEDEASMIGRKRGREVEELKTKVRDVERALKRAEEDRDELDRLNRDWKRRREDLEEQVQRSTTETSDIRHAMSELRDALDDCERQSRDLEKEKVELKKMADEAQSRIEKMQKTNRSMAEEIRTLKKPNSTAPSSRSSMDSRVGSPAPRNPSVAKEMPPGTMTDYVYLKNVLLQFLEQKDKNHQKQLIPVLGMLLHFDKRDEQKWMSAIAAR